MSEKSDITLKVLIGLAMFAIIITVLIALAVLIHKNQKLEACDRIADNAARIICISDQ